LKTLLSQRTRLSRSESSYIRRQDTQVLVQTSILSQYGNVAVRPSDCVQTLNEATSSTTFHDLDSATIVADAADTATAVGAVEVVESAADSANSTQMDMAMPDLYNSSQTSPDWDAAESPTSSTDEGRATALRRPANADTSASQVRQDLLDWNFNPFTADTLKKCKMIEAMFYTLGVSQVKILVHT
jgi:hypothetical protein